MNWIKGNIYPKNSGKYIAIFPSGRKVKALFTLISPYSNNSKGYGKWGEGEIWGDYTPLVNPLIWLDEIIY